MSRDLYGILGVDPDVDAAALKKAYRSKARELHPDRNPDPAAAEQFREVATAWETLGDPERRAAYDHAQGRRARGELPPAFLEDVAAALERAEGWVRRGVLPHYARHHRGDGLEMAVRILVDLERLRVPRTLEATQGWRRRAVERKARDIVLTASMVPSRQLSAWHRLSPRRHEILVLPWALHHEGVEDGAVLDDLVLQIVVMRFAMVLGAWRLPPGTEGEAAIAWARRQDDRVVASVRSKWIFRAVLAGTLGAMFTAGYMGW